MTIIPKSDVASANHHARLPQNGQPGFSIIQIMIALSLVLIGAIAGTVIIPRYQQGTQAERLDDRVTEALRVKKLKLDIAEINKAVREYQAMGGRFEPGLSVEEVLALLDAHR